MPQGAQYFESIRRKRVPISRESISKIFGALLCELKEGGRLLANFKNIGEYFLFDIRWFDNVDAGYMCLLYGDHEQSIFLDVSKSFCYRTPQETCWLESCPTARVQEDGMD